MGIFRSHHLAFALAALVMTRACFFATADMYAASHIWLNRTNLQPVSPGDYRVYIVFLDSTGADDGMVDKAAHRAWHASFLPSETTRDGRQRLRASYTRAANGFSAFLTDDEAKLLAEKEGVLRVIPNTLRYKNKQITHPRQTSPVHSRIII